MRKIRQIFLWNLFFVFTLYALRFTLSYADTQSVSVTGSVAPHSSDFQLSLVNDTTGTLSQYKTVTYTITYGTHLLYADHITLEAYWDKGTVSGDTNPSVTPLTYVSGSATNAYGTTPVVDLTNNAISWSISSFPANTTNQTVSFQLLTNTSYTGPGTVDFPVKVRLLASNYTTTYQTTHITYQYDSTNSPPPTPTPTTAPTSGPTSTPTPTVLPGTPTPTIKLPIITPIPTIPAVKPIPTFNSISILNLNSSSADISYIVTKNENVTFVYGTSAQTLGNPQSSSNPGYGTFHIDTLSPKQTYYFQLRSGSDASEVFSFTTPVASQVAQVVKTSLVIATNSDVLYSAGLATSQQLPTAAQQTTPSVAVAQSTTYSLSFKITKTEQIASVQVLLQNANVLGIATPAFAQDYQQYPYIYTASDKGNGVYAANIANNLPPGNYNMLLVVRDSQGNITTEHVATVHVLHPFQAFNSISKDPIEDVRIGLYRLDNGRYELISDPGVKNPLYTGRFGTVEEQLVTGKYKAIFARVGYEDSTVFFSVNTSPKDDYPTVYMKPVPITPARILGYYFNSFVDFLALNEAYIQGLHASYRFFDLIGLAVIFCSVVATFMLFSFKARVRFSHLWWYIHHHTLLLAGKSQTPYLSGKVYDKVTGEPVPGAKVFVFVATTKQLLREVATNAAGNFLLPKGEHVNYLVSIMKEGYRPVDEAIFEHGMSLGIEKEKAAFALGSSLSHIIGNLSSLLFEFLLLLSLIFEIVLFPAFGLSKTVPFLAGSIFNIFLWLLYLREKRR